jgi:two-component system phosphate regulon sensor histidine kinase PhoR
MKYSSPKNLALLVSFLIVAFFSLICIIIKIIFYPDIQLCLPLIIIDVLLFVFSYFAYSLSLENFIYKRIKLIYKTIHNLKLYRSDKRRKSFFTGNSDIIKNVNHKVSEWAQDKKKEIEQLKKTENYRREFLGNVSHELKTPIFNIQGYVLTLLEGGLEDPTINRDYLLRTEKSIVRMIAIVEDLETISQLESDESKLKFEKFDILSLTKEIIKSLEITAKKKNINIYFAKDYEKPVCVYADKKRIHQVLVNLIDNSIKYSNENSKIKISFFDMDKNVLIEVTDKGIGILAKNIPHIFERFYRVDKSRSREQGGSGLGLSIVKHIIETHNQTINVRSSIDGGTTFAFTLEKD